MCHLAKGGTFFMDKSCCFIGHRKIEEKEIAYALLKKEIELLFPNVAFDGVPSAILSV